MPDLKTIESELTDPLGINKRVVNAIKKFVKKPLVKKKIGLALGGGGLWGMAHIGVLKVLEENKINIDFIVGTSIGAVIGAIYALNPDAGELEKKALSLTKKDLIDFFDLTLPKFSLISGKNIKKFVQGIVRGKTFSDVKIPLKITATDLETGREVILDDGKLIDAIMASISIPGVFPPVKYKNSLLVDGGLVDPTPISVVKKMGAEVVIGVDLSTTSEVDYKRINLLKVLIRSYEILKSKSTISTMNITDKKTIVIRPDMKKLKKFKFYETKKLISEGERAAKQSITEIKKLTKNFS